MTPREFLDWAEQLRHMNGELVIRNADGDFEAFDPLRLAVVVPLQVPKPRSGIVGVGQYYGDAILKPSKIDEVR